MEVIVPAIWHRSQGTPMTPFPALAQPELLQSSRLRPKFLQWAVEPSVGSFRAQGVFYDPIKTNPDSHLGAADLGALPSKPEVLEGTWALPGCDTSSHAEWNHNYEADMSANDAGLFPCMCRPSGRDPADFIKAVSMRPHYDWNDCASYWTKNGDFPDEVDEISYGNFLASERTDSRLSNSSWLVLCIS